MKTQSRMLTVAIASILGLGSAMVATSGAVASTPAPPPPALVSVSNSNAPLTAAQSNARGVVADFVAKNPQPTTTSKDPSVFAAESLSLLSYWKSAPLADWYGQWGCTVSNVTVAMQTGDDGVSRASASFGNHCPAGVDPSSIGSTIAARPLGDAAQRSSVLTPLVVVHNCSALISSGYHCYSLDTSAGTLINTYTYEGSGSITGHVRVGQIGPTGCSNGTFLGNSGNVALTAGNGVSLLLSENVDSNWSNSFYYSTNTFRSRYCYAA